MKILLAVDNSVFTSHAVAYLVSHLQSFGDGVELHLLHVKLPIPHGLAIKQARHMLGDDAVTDYYKEESQKVLAPTEETLRRKGIPFQSHFRVGDIAQEINAYAQENNIDMIVMGSHGHGALANVLLGSIATKVLATTIVPVLIVR